MIEADVARAWEVAGSESRAVDVVVFTIGNTDSSSPHYII